MDKVFLANTWQRLPVDALETVTFFSKVNQKLALSGQVVPNVHRLPVKIDVVTDEDAQLAKNGVMFDMWASQTGAVNWGNPADPRPKINDVLQDATGTKYVVKRAEAFDMGQRFRMLCLEG